MNKCLVLFVEGETEIEFYKAVISFARGKLKNKRFDTCIECENVNGIGGFKNIALRRFEKKVKPKYDEACKFTVVEQKPPVNWDEVRNDLISAGAHDVILVRAKKSIEDWFLYDSDSIVSFLRLKKGEKITGSNGYDKLKRLYKKANKMYFKVMEWLKNLILRKYHLQ